MIAVNSDTTILISLTHSCISGTKAGTDRITHANSHFPNTTISSLDEWRMSTKCINKCRIMANLISTKLTHFMFLVGII